MLMLSSSMFGMVLVSLGVLGMIVSLLILDVRRFKVGLGLSIFLMVVGVFYMLNSGFNQWSNSRRMAKIQQENMEKMKELREKMQQNTPPQPAGGQQPPAPSRPKRR